MGCISWGAALAWAAAATARTATGWDPRAADRVAEAYITPPGPVCGGGGDPSSTPKLMLPLVTLMPFRA